MNTQRECGKISITLLALLCPALAAAASAPDRESCAALGKRSTAQIQVQTAEWVAASRPAAAAGPVAPGQPAAMPEHCLVRLIIDARPSGLPEMSYGTGVELRLPRDWNGRLLFQGAGAGDGPTGRSE